MFSHRLYFRLDNLQSCELARGRGSQWEHGDHGDNSHHQSLVRDHRPGPLVMTGHECCQCPAGKQLFAAPGRIIASSLGKRSREIRRAIKLVLWIILTRFGCGDGDNRNWDIVRKLSRGIIFQLGLSWLPPMCRAAPFAAYSP